VALITCQSLPGVQANPLLKRRLFFPATANPWGIGGHGN